MSGGRAAFELAFAAAARSFAPPEPDAAAAGALLALGFAFAAVTDAAVCAI